MPYKDKCVSICQQFPKGECNPPRCKYINGSTHKYCRLSHKYKMRKPNCNVTRKVKKSELQTTARAKIGEMIKKSGMFLKMICSDSSVCTAFGKSTKEIREYFKGFTGFDYVVNPITPIGEVSENGFIKLLQYSRNNYNAYAILKSSKTSTSDNLIYEYIVGERYINRVMERFPCFVETYGAYYYKSSEKWKTFHDSKILTKPHLNSLESQKSIEWDKACKSSKYAAILIEQIKDASSLSSCYKNNTTQIIEGHLLYILFIIYHALSSISKEFTHYDLHAGNILLYEPKKGKYIKYVYHLNDTMITFHCPYIPKIIDYGRSFFDNGNLNSKKIYNKVCDVKECNPNCGGAKGLGWLNPTPYIQISSYQKNESHDLRVLNILKDRTKTIPKKRLNKTGKKTLELLNKVVYGVGVKSPNKSYGTVQNLSMNSAKIYNVNSAYKILKKQIEDNEIMEENKKLYNDPDNCIGTLNIYDDGRPIKYEL